MYARFSNIRESLQVHPEICKLESGLRVEFISPKEFSQVGAIAYNSNKCLLTHDKMANPMVNLTTAYEGQVSVVVHATAEVSDGWKKAERVIKKILQGEGDIFAFKRISSTVDGIFRAVAEFSDINSSLTAVSRLDGLILEVR